MEEEEEEEEEALSPFPSVIGGVKPPFRDEVDVEGWSAKTTLVLADPVASAAAAPGGGAAAAFTADPVALSSLFVASLP